MIRVSTLALITLLLAVADSSESEAQLFRGRSISRATTSQSHLGSPPLFYKSPGHVGVNIPQDYSQPPVFPTEAYFENRAPMISRILDGKMTHKHRHPAEVDARYTGGFHQSHYQNIGIPSGDIGIRGNAYNWRTW